MTMNKLGALLAGFVVFWPTAFAGTVMVPGLGGGIEVSVSSFQERKFSSVFRQQYDYSCGSAALASLLTYHYGDEVSEQAVFSGMFAVADHDKVRREGFSMLDMKRYLQTRGYQADGFRMPLEGLRDKVRLPVIVLITVDGFRHFVIIKGISAEEVLVGDPARGLKAYTRERFERLWDGAAFVIRSHLAQGRDNFLPEDRWPDLARAPLSSVKEGPPVGHTLPYWPSSGEW
ncbi:MAG: C39 family peptidase [Marinobacter adhaerens]